MILEVQSRDKNIKAKELLRSDLIPAEYYGRGVNNQSVKMDYQTFRKLFRVAGTNTIVELKVDGKDPINVLVHRVDQDPVTDRYTHVDFINVRMGEIIHTKVPIHLTGVAPAVKELAGTLTHQLNEIDVKCLPKDLIHSIDVDIASLVDFNCFIRVKDLNIPSTVEVLNDSEDVVATVVPPRVEEEVEAVESTEEGGEAAAVGEASEEKSEGEKS